MPSFLPRSLLVLGADLLTTRTASRLRDPKRDLERQERAFHTHIATAAQTALGRELGLHAGLDYGEFRKLPLRTYEDFQPYIERMKRGEADVLWPGQCQFYAVSSGTTAGRTKYLPITAGMLAHFRAAGLSSLCFYTSRIGHTGIFRGKHLFLGGSTTLTPIDEVKPFVAYAGDLSGITALNLPGWAENHLYEPGADIAQIGDWPAKIDAIAQRCLHRDITLLAGIPSWVLILAEALKARATKEGQKPLHLRAIWPNLECLVHGGVPIGPFIPELRAAMGPEVNFHEVYPASEAFVAAQDAAPGEGLRLITDAGVFYEFVALDEYNDHDRSGLGAKAIPLEAVRTGVDYVILLTTPAGLLRYVIGDVVRFVSTKPPRLIYVGRTKLQLSAFGEHVIEKELTDSIAAVCERHQWRLSNFHVAPLFLDPSAGRERGRHEWWVELKPPTVQTPRGPELARELDLELMARNDDYEAKRKGGGLDAPVVRLVIPGVFEQWMRQKGKWGGQHKMPRCRSDREIADELYDLTRFSRDA